MRGCGITPFFCVDKFYIHVDLFYNFTDVLFSYLVNIQSVSYTHLTLPTIA